MSTSSADMTEQCRHRSIEIETRFVGGRSTSILTEFSLNAQFNIARLIIAKVSAEWNAGVPAAQESVLPENSGTDRPFEWPCLEDAIRASLDAFRAGWYVILIDGMPANGLDQTPELLPDTVVCFVRGCPTPAGKS